VGNGRVTAPILVAFLLWTTRGQIPVLRNIDPHDWIWQLSLLVLPLGILGIAFQLRSIVDSWRTWTWHGELREHIQIMKQLNGGS